MFDQYFHNDHKNKTKILRWLNKSCEISTKSICRINFEDHWNHTSDTRVCWLNSEITGWVTLWRKTDSASVNPVDGDLSVRWRSTRAFWETWTRLYHSSRISYLEGRSRCYVAAINRADSRRFRWGRLSSTARTKFFHFLPQSTVPRNIVIFLRLFFPCTWRKERRFTSERPHSGIIDKTGSSI